MQRRTKGEGGIYRRSDGRWCASVDLGRLSGKRRRRVVYGKTKREVAEKLFELRKAADAGGLSSTSRLTLEQYLERWLERGARPSVRPTTLVNYSSVLRCHVTPRIGSERLTALTPMRVQDLYEDLERDGASARVRRLVHAVLHRALGQAVRWQLIPQNPTDYVTRPSVPRYEARALSTTEVRRLLKTASGDPLEALYVLAVTTGLRQGELFGLRWGDIDLRHRALAVRRAVVECNGQLLVSEPKSAKGRRRVDLPDLAISAVRAHRGRITGVPHPERWVFPDSRGGALRRQNFTRRSWWPLRERAGLGAVRFHDLRHTAASLLLQAGVHPKVVQERLGHSTVALTLDVYSHVLGSLQQEAAQKLDEVLGG